MGSDKRRHIVNQYITITGRENVGKTTILANIYKILNKNRGEFHKTFLDSRIGGSGAEYVIDDLEFYDDEGKKLEDISELLNFGATQRFESMKIDIYNKNSEISLLNKYIIYAVGGGELSRIKRYREGNMNNTHRWIIVFSLENVKLDKNLTSTEPLTFMERGLASELEFIKQTINNIAISNRLPFGKKSVKNRVMLVFNKKDLFISANRKYLGDPGELKPFILRRLLPSVRDRLSKMFIETDYFTRPDFYEKTAVMSAIYPDKEFGEYKKIIGYIFS